MAQYERFLSYLFEYDQDIKGDNCGFAKIEVRGETVRIQITIKERKQIELLHVYAFYREEEHCVCVPLGRMMINSGNGQFQYTSSGPCLSGSQVMFSQIRGIVLSNPQAAGQAYATVWDDEPFGLSMFEQETDEEIHTAEVGFPGMWRSGEEAGRLEPEQIIVIRREELEKEAEPEPLESAGIQEEENNIQPEESAGQEPKQDSGQEEETEMFPTPEDKEIFWAGLCRRFSRIESFPDDEIVCLKAVPADIGSLPRQNWIFGNNGFLMYSYVRYRYIVFARIKKDVFELWLPGTYGKNEEILAGMFGFERFRSMKSVNASDGDFGYWCVPISVPQNQEIQRMYR